MGQFNNSLTAAFKPQNHVVSLLPVVVIILVVVLIIPFGG
jgi:hypothetical protein